MQAGRLMRAAAPPPLLRQLPAVCTSTFAVPHRTHIVRPQKHRFTRAMGINVAYLVPFQAYVHGSSVGAVCEALGLNDRSCPDLSANAYELLTLGLRH